MIVDLLQLINDISVCDVSLWLCEDQSDQTHLLVLLLPNVYNCSVMLLQLFDFNIEVKPVLEVLVGKTIEQSLIEVMEEEELSNLREQQRQFQELRNAELVEQQRLEEEDRRRRIEKVRTHIFFCAVIL